MRDSIDACLTRAIRDVAVPEGLADRLLAGIADTRPRSRSRRWLFAAAGVAAAAGILLAVCLHLPKRAIFSEDAALAEAILLFDAGFGQPGHLLAKQPAPADFPFSPWVLHVRGITWRHLDNFMGRSGVVYDLLGPDGSRASLFVVSADGVEGLDTMPTVKPFETAGRAASAWKDGEILYVLVVQGDYNSYLTLPRSPMA